MSNEETKARELIHKFVQYTPAEEELEWEYAKQCAIIHCNEVIEIIKKSDEFNMIYRTDLCVEYQSIISHIEKL